MFYVYESFLSLVSQLSFCSVNRVSSPSNPLSSMGPSLSSPQDLPPPLSSEECRCVHHLLPNSFVLYFSIFISLTIFIRTPHVFLAFSPPTHPHPLLPLFPTSILLLGVLLSEFFFSFSFAFAFCCPTSLTLYLVVEVITNSFVIATVTEAICAPLCSFLSTSCSSPSSLPTKNLG